MATISNTPRPGYVWDSTDNVWYPIGVGGHSHPDYITQATAISPTTVDAKGDLLVGSAADTIARLAVGNSGEQIVADSSATTGLRYQSNFAAGKNAIINGAFNVWQRGTSISLTNGVEVYTADRFAAKCNFTAGTSTVTQQTFTPGTAPAAGYESQYFARLTCGSTSTYGYFTQRIEDVRTFAGQTITISLWAKASAAVTLSVTPVQNFGSGGSSPVNGSTGNATLTTSWVRYSFTQTLASISGKTVGTSSFVQIYAELANNMNSATIDIWGVQVEASNTATAFQTATGTLQGELAACQRYYYLLASGAGQMIANGFYVSATQYSSVVPLPVTMRSTPTLSVVTGSNYYATWNGASDLLDSLTILLAGTKVTGLTNTTEAAGTAYRPAYLETNNAASFVAYSAEL